MPAHTIGVGIALLAAGLGLRHAVAPDHLAAVGTFVRASDATPRRGTAFALRIGVGHALGMVAVAVVALWVLHGLPVALTGIISRMAGGWLILLTLWMLGDLARSWWQARPGHFEQALWRPRATGGRGPSGWVRHPLAAWLVGLMFGLAVSPGDLAIFTLVISQAARPWWGALLLGVFLLAMLAALAALGAVLGNRGAGQGQRWRPWISGASGVFGLGVGVALVLGLLH